MHPLRWVKNNKAMSFILLFYFFVALALFVGWKEITPLSNPDSYSYLDTARYLRKDHFFSQDGVTPDTFRTPGYPLLIAALSYITSNQLAISCVQIFLVTVALLLIYQVVVQATQSKWAGCVAASAMLFDIVTYWHSQTILSEVPFMFLLVCSIYCLSQYMHKGQKGIWFLLFSIALNYALLVRPILSYFNALFCLAVLFMAVKKKIPWRHALSFILIFTLVYCGWSYRNYVHGKVFTYSTVRDFNLLYWDAARLLERVEGIPASQQYYGVDRMDEMFREQMRHLPLEQLTSAQLSKLQAQVGSAYIAAHFGPYLLQNISGAIGILFYPCRELIAMVTRSALLNWLIPLLYAGFLLLVHCLYALGYALRFFQYRIKPSAMDYFLFLLICYQLAAGASLAFSRFRVPIFPLELIAVGINLPLIAKALRALLPRKQATEVG